MAIHSIPAPLAVKSGDVCCSQACGAVRTHARPALARHEGDGAPPPRCEAGYFARAPRIVNEQADPPAATRLLLASAVYLAPHASSNLDRRAVPKAGATGVGPAVIVTNSDGSDEYARLLEPAALRLDQPHDRRNLSSRTLLAQNGTTIEPTAPRKSAGSPVFAGDPAYRGERFRSALEVQIPSRPTKAF